MCVAAAQDRVYAMGGMVGPAGSTATAANHAYDPAADTWTMEVFY